MFRRNRPGAGPFKKIRLLSSRSVGLDQEIVQRAPILSGYKERPRRGVDLALNLLLTTLAVVAVQAPFVQTDWQRPVRATARQVEQAPNLLLSTLAPAAPQPFAQLEWPRSRGGVRLPADLPQNLIGTTLAPVAEPFSLPDWPRPRSRLRLPSEQAQNLLATTLAPAAPETPFAQIEWPRPKRPTEGSHVLYHRGFLQEPFAQLEWRAPTRGRRVDTGPAPNLLGTVLAPAAADAPFSQPEWFSPRRTIRRGDELFLVGLPLLAPLPPEPPEPPAEVQPTPGCYPPSPFRRETLHLRKREAARPAERAVSVSVATQGTGQGNALIQGFTPRQLPAAGPLPQELPPETDDDEEILMAMLMVI